LEKLAEFPRPWRAHFHCTLALAAQEGVVQLSTGDCRGEIIPQERGDSGFGYDPIFFLPEMGRTMAELTLAEKNQVSHRARALRAAIPALLEIR
jgi:XTP/dITP diphosphohydrolase